MTSKTPFESSATPTTATNSATYLMNSRLLVLPAGAVFGAAAPATGDGASARPSVVSGSKEMVIPHLLARRHELVSCRSAARLLDDLVRQGQQGRRNLQAHGVGGFQVEDQRIAGRLLERQFGRARALEDAVDQVGRPLERFLDVGAIGHQPAVAGQKVIFVDRLDSFGGCEFEHALAVEVGEGV